MKEEDFFDDNSRNEEYEEYDDEEQFRKKEQETDEKTRKLKRMTENFSKKSAKIGDSLMMIGIVMFIIVALGGKAVRIFKGDSGGNKEFVQEQETQNQEMEAAGEYKEPEEPLEYRSETEYENETEGNGTQSG